MDSDTPKHGNDDLEMARIKKQVADKDGLRNTVDDLLTNSETDNLPIEDKHEDLP